MAFAYGGWERFNGDEKELRRYFGFDNVELPSGFEPVPVDWYAIPRFPARRQPGADGYLRYIDDRFGRVVKSIPASPEHPFGVRVFERHVVKDRKDWLEVRSCFRPSIEARFPRKWAEWCEHSRRADHPIVLDIRDAASIVGNLLGEDLFFTSFYERPELVREMVRWISVMTLACVEKALKDARVDMVRVGSDTVPMVGPKVIREFFLDRDKEHIDLAGSMGVDLVCLQGRGDIRHCIPPYREIGVNGLCYVMEIGVEDYLTEIVASHGDSLFYLHAVDGRELLKGKSEIEREVEAKLKLARCFRMIPDLHVTNILPEITFERYRHYAEYLRSALFE